MENMESELLSKFKMILRENALPFFSDDELQFYYDLNKQDFNATVYECLLLKSENQSISISGFGVSDTSSYFKRLAQQYKPNNSGVLGGDV